MTDADKLKIVRLGQLAKFKDLLADVAKSGVANDVAITAITGVTGSNVQAALENIAGQIGDWKDKVVSGGYGAVVSNGQVTIKNGVTLVTPESATGVADGTYLVLTIENDASHPVFVPAQQLVDVYTAASSASEVQLSISNSNVISASVVEVSGSKLADGTVTKAKLASGVQASLDLADSALQSHQDITGKADKVTSATNGNFAALDSNGNLTDSGHKHSDYQAAGNYKTTQSAVSDPTASGYDTAFIDTISQNANGEISVTKKTVTSASASAAGLMSAAHYSKLEAITYADDTDITGMFSAS